MSSLGGVVSSTDRVDWNIYTSATWQFSIEYPRSDSVVVNSDITSSSTAGVVLSLSDPNDAAVGELTVSFQRQPIDYKGPMYSAMSSLLAYRQSQAAEYAGQSKELYTEIQLNGIPAIEERSLNLGDSLAPGAAEGYELLRGSVIYDVSWSPPHGPLAEVASTFKFLSLP
jgi:hypothetical protein